MSGSTEITLPDQLEGFPHPRETLELVGHSGAERTFHESLRHGRLHHAWLLSGPEGIGKATFAYRIARFVLASRPDSDGLEANNLDTGRNSVDAQLILAGTHPNLMVIRRTWNEKTKQYSAFITIEGVRDLQNFLGTTAGRGRWRVVIIDAADDLNVNAANALLKMLEEPPSNCLFLLVSSRPGRLPVTIRSRCRRLSLEPLSAVDMSQALAAIEQQSAIKLEGIDNPELLHELSSGSIRLAIELARGGTMERYREVNRLLDLLPRVDPEMATAFVDRLAMRAADQDYNVFMHMLMIQMAKRIRNRASAAKTDADTHTLAQWAGLWETVNTMRHEAERLNLDRGLFIVDLLTRLENLARTAGGLSR